jgi:hypothetical protein
MIRRLALVACAFLLLLAVAGWAVSFSTWGRTVLQLRPVVTFARGDGEVWLSAGISDGRILFEAQGVSPTVFQSGPMKYVSVLWSRTAQIPLWLLCVLAAGACVLLAYLERIARRRQRLSSGCCVRCGYNLTGNVSGVCPECGRKVDAQAIQTG